MRIAAVLRLLRYLDYLRPLMEFCNIYNFPLCLISDSRELLRSAHDGCLPQNDWPPVYVMGCALYAITNYTRNEADRILHVGVGARTCIVRNALVKVGIEWAPELAVTAVKVLTINGTEEVYLAVPATDGGKTPKALTEFFDDGQLILYSPGEERCKITGIIVELQYGILALRQFWGVPNQTSNPNGSFQTCRRKARRNTLVRGGRDQSGPGSDVPKEADAQDEASS